MTGKDGDFRVTATDRSGKIHDYRTQKVIVSTGYYDLPNPLGIPGEDLGKVHHYYKEPIRTTTAMWSWWAGRIPQLKRLSICGGTARV